ncbi:transcriptional regulator [Kingella negevensis]|uniref:transcriptional regulator n=1 Tax=Kingella negevensis TaxID=1522312 RepID=UPI001FEA5095|nr:transcriptional regulator [Kingella negevensis]WII91870.1 transcriptional regulator [Kingella negevensis]
MSQVHEAEIRQLIADVMRDTGIRIDADDPIVAMLFAQKRELAKFLQQSSDEQTAQHQRFLADFKTLSDGIITAAAELQNQKQQMVAELMQANANDRAEIEQKLFGSISQRIQTQFQAQAAELAKHISGSLKMGVMVWAVVQMLIFAVMIFLLK